MKQSQKQLTVQNYGELTARAKAGDQSACTVLYEATYPGLYRTLRAMISEAADVEDILQETYLKAFSHLNTLQQTEVFPSWLHRIAVNEAKNQLKKKKALCFSELGDEEKPFDLPDDRVELQPEEVLSQKEAQRLVREIVDGLPPEQHLVVGLYYYDELPVREIAAQLELPDGTVKSQLFAARKKIRQRVLDLEKKGVRLRALTPIGFFRLALRVSLDQPVRQAPPLPNPSIVKTDKPFLQTLWGRAAVGAAALAVAVGGYLELRALDRHFRQNQIGDERPSQLQLLLEPTEPAESGELNGICGDSVTWSLDPETGVLTIAGSGRMDDIEGPPEMGMDELAVQPWSDNQESIKAVRILDGVTAIGNHSFSACSEITSVTIPDSVTRIGSLAFASCFSLTSITIPDSVTEIGEGAFEGCKALSSVTVPGSIDRLEERVFLDCSSLSSFVIPEGVTSIGACAFWGCTALTDIRIPDSVSVIHDCAFQGCRALTEVRIPDSVSVMGSAFEGCSSLEKIRIPEGVTCLESGIFRHCTALKEIIIPDTVTAIWPEAFMGCTSLADIDLPDGITEIDEQTFLDCTALTSIRFPDSVAEIDSRAFFGCSALTGIRIPDGVTSVGEYAFCDCTSLKEAILPESVSFIGGSAFYNCPALKEIVIRGSEISIGAYAFGYCSTGNCPFEKKVSDFSVVGIPGSAAETYAEENGFRFQPLSDYALQPAQE